MWDPEVVLEYLGGPGVTQGPHKREADAESEIGRCRQEP